MNFNVSHIFQQFILAYIPTQTLNSTNDSLCYLLDGEFGLFFVAYHTFSGYNEKTKENVLRVRLLLICLFEVQKVILKLCFSTDQTWKDSQFTWGEIGCCWRALPIFLRNFGGFLGRGQFAQQTIRAIEGHFLRQIFLTFFNTIYDCCTTQ